MGLFKKREKRAETLTTYKIYMNHSGKAADPAVETPIVTADGEFLAVRDAEKQFPKLKVAKVERAD